MTALSTRIAEDWKEQARIAQACISVYDFLESSALDVVSELSFFDIKKIASSTVELSDKEIALVIQYLTGAGIGVLDIRCYFDDGEHEYLLPDDEYIDAVTTGLIAHPATGEEIRNANHFLYPWFVPGRIFGKSI